MSRIFRTSLLVGALAGLAACSVGPGYKVPDVAPIRLASPQAAAFARADGQPASDWWLFFDDPQLARLIADAVAHNRDIRTARATVLLARAAFDEQDLQRLPVVTSGLTYQRSLEQQPVTAARPARSLAESWRAGLDLQWELDLFGRLDHLSRAAESRAEASQADLEQTHLTIAVEVARAYFAAQGQRRRLLLASDEVRSWGETRRMVEAQLLAGNGVPEDLENVRSNLLQAQAAIAPLEAQLRKSFYRLDVLAGQRPGSPATPLAPLPPSPLARQLPLGDVEGLIRNRPDVVRAERMLAASVEDVGAATADLYPRFNLGGFIGFFALREGDLGSASRAFELTPGLTWPALDLGSARARLRGAEAVSQGQTARFEQTLLLAVEEVEGAVVQLTGHQRHLQTLVESARHAQTSLDIASRRYDAGAGTYYAVLENQRALLRTKQEIALAETESYLNAVELYRALAWRGPAGHRLSAFEH